MPASAPSAVALNPTIPGTCSCRAIASREKARTPEIRCRRRRTPYSSTNSSGRSSGVALLDLYDALRTPHVAAVVARHGELGGAGCLGDVVLFEWTHDVEDARQRGDIELAERIGHERERDDPVERARCPSGSRLQSRQANSG